MLEENRQLLALSFRWYCANEPFWSIFQRTHCPKCAARVSSSSDSNSYLARLCVEFYECYLSLCMPDSHFTNQIKQALSFILLPCHHARSSAKSVLYSNLTEWEKTGRFLNTVAFDDVIWICVRSCGRWIY